MNEALQFGPHPDADQINAFVEHALPAHEREQMLDHLSACAECRAVVALSLPSAEEPLLPAVVPIHRRWWSGWNLAWTVAAAVAALAFFVVTFHRSVVAPNTSPPSQSAQSHAPAPPVATAPSGVAPGRSNEGPAAHPERDETGTPGHNAAVSKQQSPARTLAGQDAAPSPINGRNVQALEPLAQSSLILQGGASAQNASGTGSGAGFGAAPAAGAGYSAGANASFGAAGGIAGPAADQLRAAQAASPARPVPAPHVLNQASETVAVTSAARPIETQPPDMGNLEIASPQAEVIPLKHRLPSKLAVLSVAAQGRLMVAIDTRNAVFVSKDSGGHWNAVHPQWEGRAVTAMLVGFPIVDRARNVSGRELAAQAPAASPSTPAAKNPPAVFMSRRVNSGASLTGTVTDRSGAAIPGASVTVRDSVTHSPSTVTTDRSGHYVIEGLAPGAYPLEVQAPGFRTQTLAAVAVRVDSPSVADVTLDVGAASETVEVTSAASGVETTSAPQPSEVAPPGLRAGVMASEKKGASPVVSAPAPQLFEITTDSGDRWISPDGVTWKQR